MLTLAGAIKAIVHPLSRRGYKELILIRAFTDSAPARCFQLSPVASSYRAGGNGLALQHFGSIKLSRAGKIVRAAPGGDTTGIAL